MTKLFDSLEESLVTAQSPCPGLLYRGKVNVFFNARGEYVYQERMVPLKRVSCQDPECARCGGLRDELKERLREEDRAYTVDIKHGGTYRLAVTNFSKDWETGIVDGWDLVFKLVLCGSKIRSEGQELTCTLPLGHKFAHRDGKTKGAGATSWGEPIPGLGNSSYEEDEMP